MALEGSASRFHEQWVGKTKTDGHVSSFHILFTFDERLERLRRAREETGPSLHTFGVSEIVGLEVELVSAFDSSLPCIEVEKLFR